MTFGGEGIKTWCGGDEQIFGRLWGLLPSPLRRKNPAISKCNSNIVWFCIFYLSSTLKKVLEIFKKVFACLFSN